VSKLGKLLRHPIRFWGDALRKRRGLLTPAATGIVYGSGCTPESMTDPVAVYFAGSKNQLYQLQQWVAPLQALQNGQFPVTLVCRSAAAFHWTAQHTPFKAVYCKTIQDLLHLYELNPFKCILYVNNVYRNFQSLINGRALHVHINHGESEKLSTFSNQTKAYDYVLISGPAALDKYNRNLIKKDLSRYVQIGRPQIEHIAPVPNPFGTTGPGTLTVLYAPTWEGPHDGMDYSSIVSMGHDLVRRVLQTLGHRLIYRPHPSTGLRLPAYGQAQHALGQYVQQHPMGSVQTGGDINALFEHVDIAIFDNSAVAVDYLATNKPMLLTNWLHKASQPAALPNIAQAARLIDPSHLPQLPQLLASDTKLDPFALPRQQAQAYYLGNFEASQQASTQAFVQAVATICNECDVLQQQPHNSPELQSTQAP
jgi:hypothetical protein